MFTGIVRAVGDITNITKDDTSCRITVATDLAKNLELGASIAVDGVCLTVDTLKKRTFSASLMPETATRTTLGGVQSGDCVNLEPSLRVGDEVGGHFVFGHVDDVGKITKREGASDTVVLTIEAPKDFITKFIAPRASVAVSGVSLTVVGVHRDSFTVSLVSYTVGHTTLGKKKVGGSVNLEADMLARYIHTQTAHS